MSHDETTPTGMIRISAHDFAPVEPPTGEHRPWRRYLWPVVAAAAVLAVVGAVVGGAAGRDARLAASPSPTASANFRLYGMIELSLGQFAWNDRPDKTCWGRNGYDDLAVGGSVVVTDASGKTVGLGKIDSSRPEVDINGTAEGCQLIFSVSGIAEGSQYYGVAIGHRNPVQYKRSELESAISLSI